MDDREEGELSGTEEIVDYVPVHRPDASQYRRPALHMNSSDEEYDSDSDSDAPCVPKKKRSTTHKMETDGPPPSSGRSMWGANRSTQSNGNAFMCKPKKNNIWANVLGEQTLTEEINTVGLKKLTGDRSVENYDFKAAQALMQAQYDSEEEGQIKHEEEEEEEEEDEDMQIKEKRLSRKRGAVHQRLGNNSKERHLIDIKNNPSWTDQELGEEIANALLEQKPELIVRVVQVLGRDLAIKLYTETKELEFSGGMMTVDGYRRRTSGGVYLQLLKKIPDLSSEQLQKIFPPCEKQLNQWGRRKRVPRKRVRHDSKPQGNKNNSTNPPVDDPLSDTGGVKCPGSTPVTTPHQSDSEQPPRMVEKEKLEESVVAAKLDAKINHRSKEEKDLTSYDDDCYEFSVLPDEMELF